MLTKTKAMDLYQLADSILQVSSQPLQKPEAIQIRRPPWPGRTHRYAEGCDAGSTRRPFRERPRPADIE